MKISSGFAIGGVFLAGVMFYAAVFGAAPGVQPGVYRGKLGGAEVRVEITIDPSAPDSLEGTYSFASSKKIIQIAGEVDGDELFLEESENGTDVSGEWHGRADSGHLTGTWSDADDTRHLPFDLKRVSALPKKSAAANKKKSE